jgi:hypothetical protein
MLEVPKEFLNTNKPAPAAVEKAVRQARRAYITKNREDSCTINYVDGDALTHRAPRLVQASNAYGWHGARNKARANEEQKQQQQQKQKKKQQQQQQQQRRQQQQQTSAGKKTRISSLAVDGVEARNLMHTQLPIAAVCCGHLPSAHAPPSFVRRTHRWPSRRRPRPLRSCLTNDPGSSSRSALRRRRRRALRAHSGATLVWLGVFCRSHMCRTLFSKPHINLLT